MPVVSPRGGSDWWLGIHGFRFYQMETAILASTVEMASLDIQGKAAALPVSELVGGRLRDAVPVIASVYRRLAADGCPEVSTTDEMVRYAQDLVAESRSETIKRKCGAAPPEDDIAIMRALRAALPRHNLGLHPDGVVTVATSLRVAAQLRDLDMEWCEAPTFGMLPCQRSGEGCAASQSGRGRHALAAGQ